MYDEVECEFARIAVMSAMSCEMNGALRAGLGAKFPFLSDADGRVAEELDLVEETNAAQKTFVPTTFVLDSQLRLEQAWSGFWFYGNPTPEEIRQALRAVTRREQPTFAAKHVWRGGAASPAAGIIAPVVWVRVDDDGREIWRGVHEGQALEVGAEYAPSRIEGRPWMVERVESEGETTAMYLRKAP